jgi:mono/diheme cytochrome c family protein
MLKTIHWSFALGLALLLSTSVTFAQDSAADTYKLKCQMCHGPDGLGNTPAGKSMKARSFSAPEVLKESDADLTAVIEHGKNKMPAFTGKLTDPQIAQLVAFIHTLQK